MYAVVILKHSLQNIVVPISWIDDFQVHVFGNYGAIRGTEFKIFYSENMDKQANFALPTKNYYEKLDSDSCFKAFIKRIFEKEDDATKYCTNSRRVVQADYSQQKKAALRNYSKPPVEIEDEVLNEDKQAIQQEIYAKMQEMNNQFFDLTAEEIDSIQEVLEYDGESDEDVRTDFEPSGSYVNGDDGDPDTLNEAALVQQQHSIDDFDRNETVDIVQSDVVNTNQIDDRNTADDKNPDEDVRSESSFEWVYSETDHFHKPLTSKIEVASFESYVNEDNFMDDSSSAFNEHEESHIFNDSSEAFELGINGGDSNQVTPDDAVLAQQQQSIDNSDRNEESNGDDNQNTPNDAELAQQQQSIDNSDRNEESNGDDNQNTPNDAVLAQQQQSIDNSDRSETVVGIVQTSTLNVNQTDDRNKTDSMNGALKSVRVKNEVIEETGANNANNSGNVPMFSPPSTSSNIFSGQIPTHFVRLDPSLYNVLSAQDKNQSYERQSQVSTIEGFLNLVPTLFPSKFKHEDTKLRFDEYNVVLKLGVTRMLIEWQSSPTFSSILYDAKFVHLLLIAVFTDDEIIAGKFNTKKMKFVRDAFARRIGSVADRLMRFFDYVQRCKEKTTEKSQKQNN